jgi:hypothetical protein
MNPDPPTIFLDPLADEEEPGYVPTLDVLRLVRATSTTSDDARIRRATNNSDQPTKTVHSTTPLPLNALVANCSTLNAGYSSN